MPLRRPRALLRLRVLVCVLAATSVAALAPARAALAAWYCEGQVCGTAPGHCCCYSEEGRDRHCENNPGGAPVPTETPPDEAAVCAAGCECELVVSAGGDAPPATLAAAPGVLLTPVFLAAPTPATPVPVPVLLRVASAGVAPPRGPPTADVALQSPSLRAPPLPH